MTADYYSNHHASLKVKGKNQSEEKKNLSQHAASDSCRYFDAQFFTTREADEQFGVTDETYYQWFHWDKTAE